MLQAWQFELVSHVLTVGYASMAVALLYFVLTIKTNMAKYRMSSVLSVVVMVSAFLLLMEQQNNWVDAFVYDAANQQYQYLNNFSKRVSLLEMVD